MPLVTRSRDTAARAALALAVLVVGGAALALGAVHPASLLVVTTLALVALGLHVATRVRAKRPITLSLFGAPLALGLALNVLALVPLPRFLVALLQPFGLARREFMTALLGDEARALVRSVVALDPPETSLVVLRLVAALAVFVVVADLARHRAARRLVYRIVLGVAVAVFLVAVGHRLANTDLIWGVARAHGAPFLEGPMLNANHNARIAGALSLLCLGRALVVRSRTEMAWFVFGGVTTGAMVFLSLSRGGMLAYVGTALLAMVVLFRAPAVDEEDAPRALAAGPTGRRLLAVAVAQAALLVTFGIALYLAREAIVAELATVEGETLESSKAALYGPALSLLGDYWRMGVVPGGLGVTYPAVLEPGALSANAFSYVENVAIQVLVDHGVPFGGLFLVGALLMLIAALARLETRIALVPLPALVFLVGGDLFDFALETPAGLLMAALALGLVAAHTADERRVARRVRAWPLAVGGALLVVISALVTPAAWRDNRRATDDALAAVSRDDERAALERALAIHPLDGHLAYRLAVDARRGKDLPRALDYANRALLMAPAHGGAHVEAARALAATGRLEQALLEYRLAYVAGTTSRPRLIEEVARRTRDVAARRSAVPDDDPAAVGAVCAQVRREARMDDARACFTDALTRFGDAFLDEVVELELAQKDGAAALATLERVTPFARADGAVAVLHLRALALRDGPDVAWARSQELLERARDVRPLLSWRLGEANRRGDTVEALRVLGLLRAKSARRDELDGLDRTEAELLVRLDRKGDALRLLRQLGRRRPKDVDVILRTAELELALGMLEDAKRTHAHAIALAPDGKRTIAVGLAIEQARDREREARMKALLDGSAPAPR